MHNVFFLGIILVGKEKFKAKRQKQHKTQKNFKASHFAVETVGISMDVSWLSWGMGGMDPRASLQGCFRKNHKGKTKRLAGAQTSASVKRKWDGGISGVFCS